MRGEGVSAAARDAGERGVLRPTPRSMLSSEVPVGGGCAENSRLRGEEPPCSSRSVRTPSPPPSLLLLLLLLRLSSFVFLPACPGTARGRRKKNSESERNNRPPSAVFSTGSSSLPADRERKYDGTATVMRKYVRELSRTRLTLRQMRQPAIVHENTLRFRSKGENVHDTNVHYTA